MRACRSLLIAFLGVVAVEGSLFQSHAHLTPKQAHALADAVVARLRAEGAVSGIGGEPRHPIVLIPPLSGSQLEWRLTNVPAVPLPWCPRATSGWDLAWINALYMLPTHFDCFVANMRLRLNATDGTTSFPPGVEVRPGGSFEAGLSPLPAFADLQAGYLPLVAALTKLGWSSGNNLFVHTYDWRRTLADWRAPGAPPGSFARLRRLVERAAAGSGGRQAALLSTSLGSAYGHAFLSEEVDEAWRQQHVRAFVSVSGVFAGSPLSTLDVITGEAFGATALLRQANLRELLRAMPSLAWIMPAPELWGRQVLATNRATGRSYRAADVGRLLEDAGAHQAAAAWRLLSPHTLRGAPPSVEVHAFWGNDSNTVTSFEFDTPEFAERRAAGLTYGDGDGTVPAASLAVPEGWRGRQAQAVATRVYPGVTHPHVLNTLEGLYDVCTALTGLA